MESIHYKKEVIEKFTAWVEDDATAFDWLLAFGYREFIILREATLGDSKAIEVLLKTRHIILAAFANAIWDDSEALKLLLKSKAFHWAAAANIINGDDKAQVWLMQNGLEHYITLAFKIQEQIRIQGDRGTMISFK